MAGKTSKASAEQEGAAVDVLDILNGAIRYERKSNASQQWIDELRATRDAVAELIEAASRTVRYADSEPDGGEQVEVHRANIERMRAALARAWGAK